MQPNAKHQTITTCSKIKQVKSGICLGPRGGQAINCNNPQQEKCKAEVDEPNLLNSFKKNT